MRKLIKLLRYIPFVYLLPVLLIFGLAVAPLVEAVFVGTSIWTRLNTFNWNTDSSWERIVGTAGQDGMYLVPFESVSDPAGGKTYHYIIGRASTSQNAGDQYIRSVSKVGDPAQIYTLPIDVAGYKFLSMQVFRSDAGAGDATPTTTLLTSATTFVAHVIPKGSLYPATITDASGVYMSLPAGFHIATGTKASGSGISGAPAGVIVGDATRVTTLGLSLFELGGVYNRLILDISCVVANAHTPQSTGHILIRVSK